MIFFSKNTSDPGSSPRVFPAPRGASAPLRVCMLAGNPLSFDGRVLRHAASLTSVGHEVFLIGVLGPSDPAAPLPQLPGVQLRRVDRRRTGFTSGLRWAGSALRWRLAERLTRSVGAWPLPALAVAPAALELLWAARDLHADVYHANDLDTLVPAAWLARLHRARYVYDAHELYAEESPTLSPHQRAIRSQVEQRLWQGALCTLTVNDLLADELQRRHGGPRPIVLHNVPATVPWPKPDTRDRRRPGDPLRVLLHGSWVGLEQAGVDAVLRAVAQVPAVCLTLRGGIRNVTALRARLTQLQIADRVQLQPRLPGAESLVLAALQEAQEVGLSVHLPDCVSRDLATSSKVFEYLMAGLAVLASDVTGNRHIFQTLARASAAPDSPVGELFAPGSADQLAARLQGLVDAPTRLRTMQQAARQVAVQHLCWEQEQDRLHAIYRSLPIRSP